MTNSINHSGTEYEVVICGGGLAGQTLARQLKLNYPDITIALLEKSTFPVAEAAHKVGESTIELSGDYLANDLQLKSYLLEHHLVKMGFRYFWPKNGATTFSDRTELGVSEFPPFNSYQLDVGRLENDLCSMNKALGVQILEDIIVSDIEICDTGLHEVHYKDRETKANGIIRGRWVIDALGRKCLLQKKFDLQVKSKNPHSAVWFRVKGKLDVTDFVPQSETSWHQRVPSGSRYNSTNHIMGPGYWIWIIPLASGHTSIGIVTSEAFHPFTDYITYERAIAWLDQQDPFLSQKIQQYEVIDFLKVRNYTYSSKQVFSSQRWACVGNAGLFADPFYSPGGALITYANSYVTRMIGLDRQHQLTEDIVSTYNQDMIATNDFFTKTIQGSYVYFDNSQIFSFNLLWALYEGWGIFVPLKLHSLYLDPEKNKQLNDMLADYYVLSDLMYDLFIDWSKKCQGRFNYKFISYYPSIPFIKEIHTLQVKRYDSFEQIKENLCYTLKKLEELAQVMFLLMLEDVMPEKLAKLPEPIWLNAWAMSLEPDRWQEDGLFEPQSEPRDLKPMWHQLRALYTFQDD